MNPADADRQIEQMIAFIAQEAREKAEEISVKTEKEFMADKLSLETQAAISIRADHEKNEEELGCYKENREEQTINRSTSEHNETSR